MNTLDLVCLIFILLLTILGMWHGFLRGIFRLMAWVAGVAGAYYANDLFSDFFRQSLEFSEFSTTLVCIALGFLVPFLILLLIGHLLKNAISETSFGTFDRILGSILGFTKGSLIWFAFFTILHIMPFGETLIKTRDSAWSYGVYKSSLKLMGFSSEPIDLVDMAEKKAANIVEKATDKASDVADKAASTAKDAARDAAKDAVNEVKKNVMEKNSP